MYLRLNVGLVQELICVGNNSVGITRPIEVSCTGIGLALTIVEDLNGWVTLHFKSGGKSCLNGGVYFAQLYLTLKTGSSFVPFWL